MRINFIIFGLLVKLSLLCSSEAILFKLTNAVCKNFNESRLILNECRLQGVNPEKLVLNINATVFHPVYNAVIEGQLFKKAKDYKPWLYKAKIDCCRFIKKPYNPVAIIIFKQFKAFSNFNHTCPYVGPVFVKELYPRFELLPHAIPTGDYLLALNWLLDKKLQVKTDIYFSFKED